MKNRSENSAERGQILPCLQVNSRSIDQKNGEIWTAQANLQPISFKSDRLLACWLRLVLAWALTWHVSLSHAERADRDQPVHLEAEQVSIDDARQISTFVGKVLLTQGTLTIRGDKLVVKQNQEGLQLGTATGQPASFRQKREGFEEYVEGYGERIEYDSANTSVDLYGQARIQRGYDEVRGAHISYNFKTEIFQARSTLDQGAESGGKERVQVIIQPKNNPVPATPVEDNSPASNQPESTP